MVVLLSPEACESEWVNNEITLAKKRNLRIFPVLARGDEDDAVPLTLVSVQYVDARDDYEGAVRGRLLPAVRKHLGMSPAGESKHMPADGGHKTKDRPPPETERQSSGSGAATPKPSSTPPLDVDWAVISAGIRPYVERGEAAAAALSALAIAREQGLFAADPDDLEIRGSDFKALHAAALRVLVDVEHFTPEQRNVAGELLGARPEHDSRPGAGVRADGLPDIDWVEVPELDPEGNAAFIYGDDEPRTEQTFWMARLPITCGQYQAFVDAGGHAYARWWKDLAASDHVLRGPGKQAFPFWNHPHVEVSWYEAVAFCRWLSWRAKERSDLLPRALRRERLAHQPADRMAVGEGGARP